MPVKCRICNKEFPKLISSTHLKTHNIKTADYKQKYGRESLTSLEYRTECSRANSGKNNPNYGNRLSDDAKQAISKSNTGRVAWNKGVAQSNVVKQAISRANTGKAAWNRGQQHTDETKEKIKNARKRQLITTESVQKALATKRQKGYDLAPFRGMKHSDASRRLISESSKRTAKKKKELALDYAQKRLTAHGYKIKTVYDNRVEVECNKGHLMDYTRQYLTESKFKETMCPICYPRDIVVSQAEKELREFVAKLADIKTNDRTVIAPLELDIVIPKAQVAVEFNGLYWHSDKHKESSYHKNKMEQCNQQGYKLIQVFEDEWKHKQDIVKSRIRSLLQTNNSVYARKCSVVELDSTTANRFLNSNHLQGTGRSNVRYGLIHNDKLVAVMTFLKSDISKKVVDWELNRYASLLDHNVVGGASRLLKAFIKEHAPKKITTFADLRWSNLSSFYTTLGFGFVYNSPPNYWYVYKNETKRRHRYSLRKPENCNFTERELRESEGYFRVYDCGNAKFEMHF